MERALKTIIVDDETPARRGLRNRLKSIGDVQIIAEASNGREALDLIREHAPDLVFLDIQMPGMDGFDVLRALQPRQMPAIVFVTTLDDYAIKAFEAHGLDYLLKPIGDRRLAEALDRVRENRMLRQSTRHRKSLLELVGQITGQGVASKHDLKARGVDRPQRKESARLKLKDGSRTTTVNQRDIQWIDAAGDYMCVHVSDETYIVRMTMKQLEQELDPAILQRVHRSTIVNVGQVREMQAHINGEYFLILKSGQKIKLSRSYKNKLHYFS